MPTALRSLLLAVVFTVLPVGIGVAMTGQDGPTPPPAYAGTPLRDFDTTTVAITRGEFCHRIPGAAVTAALGAAATSAHDYADGDRVTVAPGVKDVAHEYGCDLRKGKAEARAWVFAPPVTRARAAQLAEAHARGCVVQKGAPAFGTPSVARLCAHGHTATYAGLFGDAWLSCSLTVPTGPQGAALLDRAGQWCVAVAKAAETPAPAG
ncbi:hypothetical protein [Nocardioides montaniterrae]